jgi:hypothetical protein
MLRRRSFGAGREVKRLVRSGSHLLKGLNSLADDLHGGLTAATESGTLDRSIREGIPSQKPSSTGTSDLAMRPYLFKVAGVTHSNSDGTSRQRIIRSLRLGQELKLVRERTNAYDPNAIRVETMAGRPIGYVERERAVRLALSMDKGVLSRSFVSYLTTGDVSGVRVRVLRQKTTPKANSLSGNLISAPKSSQQNCPEQVSEAFGETASDNRLRANVFSPTVLFGVASLAFLTYVFHGC